MSEVERSGISIDGTSIITVSQIIIDGTYSTGLSQQNNCRFLYMNLYMNDNEFNFNVFPYNRRRRLIAYQENIMQTTVVYIRLILTTTLYLLLFYSIR